MEGIITSDEWEELQMNAPGSKAAQRQLALMMDIKKEGQV